MPTLTPEAAEQQLGGAMEGPVAMGDGFAERLRTGPHVSEIERPEVRQAITECPVIYGYNTASGGVHAFYGRAAIEELAKMGDDGASLDMLCFRYDGNTSELAYFIAAIETLKGSCCYDPDKGKDLNGW